METSWLTIWWVQALIISAGTCLFLNGCPFLPYLRDIKPRRIQARLVGYIGLGVAYLLWCRLNPQQPAWPNALEAYAIIVGSTLGANVLVHWYRQDNPDDHHAGGVKVIEFRLTEEGEALLERYLEERIPGDPQLAQLFRMEQRRETAQERWEDTLMPRKLLSLLDEAIACVAQALMEDNQGWLYTAVADMQEVRDIVCRTKHHVHLWFRLFWPEHAA